MLEEPGSLNSYNVQQLQFALSDPKQLDIFGSIHEDNQRIFAYGDRRMSSSANSATETSDSSISRGEKRALTPQSGELDEPNQKRSRIDDDPKAPHLPNILTTFDRRNSLPNASNPAPARYPRPSYNPTTLSAYTFPPTETHDGEFSGITASSASNSAFPPFTADSSNGSGNSQWSNFDSVGANPGGSVSAGPEFSSFDHLPRPSSTPGSGGFLSPNLTQPVSMRHASFSAAEHSLNGQRTSSNEMRHGPPSNVRISGHSSPPGESRRSYSAVERPKDEWTYKFPTEDFAHSQRDSGSPGLMSPPLDNGGGRSPGGRVNREPSNRVTHSPIGRVTRSRSSNAGLEDDQQQQLLPQSIIASTSSLAGAVIPPGQPGGLPAQRKRGKLPKETTDFLKSWLHRHSEHPYPSEEEKKQLCHATGLSMSQVSNWMINARRRILAPAQRAASGPTTTAPFPTSNGGRSNAHDSRSNSLHDARGASRPMHPQQQGRSPASLYDQRSNSMMDPRMGGGGGGGGYGSSNGGGMLMDSRYRGGGVPMLEGRRASMPSDPLQLYPAMSLQTLPGIDMHGLGGPGYAREYRGGGEGVYSARGEYRVAPRSSGGWSESGNGGGQGQYSPGFNGPSGDQYFGDGGSSNTRSSPHHSGHGTPQ